MNAKRDILNFIHIFRPIYVPISNFIRSTFGTQGYVFAICKFIRRLPNAYFRGYVNNYRNPIEHDEGKTQRHPIMNMQVHVLGNKNKGKVIMLLENQSHHAGFCALWVYFLNRLSFSDKKGFYHVIDWNESEFYQEDHPINGSTSIFEYYFEQPCGISIEDARKSNFVIYDWNNPEFGYNDTFHVGDTNDYKFTTADIEQFAKIQRKYIHLHKDIENSIKDQIEKLFQGSANVLGVHARGADTKIGYKGHPTIVTSEDYIDETRKMSEKIKADLIFLATDDQEMLDQFKVAFGDKLVYYEDVIRSTGTIMNCFIEKERENHHYLLGLEIVRDVYTLAACKGFVCGMSYVSFIVQILKKANNQKFRGFHRIFKGIKADGVDLNDANARKKISEKWEKELGIDGKKKLLNNKNIYQENEKDQDYE